MKKDFKKSNAFDNLYDAVEDFVKTKINNSDYEFEEDIEDIRKEIIDNLFNEKFPQICFKTDVKVIIKGKQVSIYTGEFYEYSYMYLMAL